MNEHDARDARDARDASRAYDAWVLELRANAVPAGFTERVMARVRAGDAAGAQDLATPPSWYDRPLLRVAAWAGAAAVLAVRIAATFLLFLES